LNSGLRVGHFQSVRHVTRYSATNNFTKQNVGFSQGHPNPKTPDVDDGDHFWLETQPAQPRVGGKGVDAGGFVLKIPKNIRHLA